jgi:hypothetical protein
MAIRTINYTVSVGGITPASQQFGGTQGDHNAVELKFTLDTELYNNVTANAEGTVYYRFDGYDGSGGVKSTEPAPLDDSVCTYGLEEWLTRYGGKVQVYLVLTDITDTTEMELYSFPAVLNLKDRPDGHSVDGGDYESISTLYEGAKASADKAEDAATRAEQVLDDIGGAIPDIDVTEVSDGVEITVTSKEGIETAKVYNGRDGADGKDGKDGKDVDYSLVANALKGSASGGVVAIKDVSPLPHTVLVKASGGGVDGELLTKTVEVTEPMQEVLLDTPSESVRVVVSGGSYCVGGLVPMVDGDDLTASDMKDELALWPTWSYGEAPGHYDLVYTISGNVLSWSGTKYYMSYDGVIEQSEDISGSVELSTVGQKIIGFCQIYDLDEDNPFAENPEHDNLDMTVAIYESTQSVEVKVYGKNLLPSNFADLSTWSGSYFYFDLPVGYYTFTFELNAPEDTTNYGYLYIYKSNDNWATKTNAANNNNPVIGNYVTKKFTFNILEGYQYAFWMYGLANQIQYFSDFQLEVGKSGTGYEPYIEPKTYTVTANGTAIVSIYPSMTFIPEKDGVELSVEYNRDINKAFAQLQAALISMGGNI